MAKRSRVPSHKTLPDGKSNRNKNPKLSPFQRELKRNRLANQAPHVVHQKGGGRGAAGLRDEPAKARDLMKYLNAKDEYEKEKIRVKADRRQAMQEQKLAEEAAANGEVYVPVGAEAESHTDEESDGEEGSANQADDVEAGEAGEETDEELTSDDLDAIEAAGGVVGNVVVLTPVQKRGVELKTMKKLKKSSNNYLKSLMTKKERVTYFGITKVGEDEEVEQGPATAEVSATVSEETEASRQKLLSVLVRRSGMLDTALDTERERLTKLVQAAERKQARLKLRGEDDDVDDSAPFTKAEIAALAPAVGGYKKRKKGEDEDEGGPVTAQVHDVNQEMLIEGGMAKAKKQRAEGSDEDISSDTTSDDDDRQMHHSGLYDAHTTALMKRKERKHLKKMEQRREKRADQLADIEREVHELTSKTHKKKMRKEARGTDEEKHEAQLYRLQAEERRTGKRSQRDGEEAEGGPAVKRLSGLGDEEMSMREAIEELRGGSAKTRASGIRFGERVDAPPTFDSIPSMDIKTSLNKLANRLATVVPAPKNVGKAPTTTLGKTAKNSMVPRDMVMPSSHDGASMSLSEKKRLSKLGLRSRMNEAHGHAEAAPINDGGANKQGGASTSEFEAMRSQVMNNYASSKRRAHEQMLAAKKEAGPKHKKRSNIANFVVSGGGEDDGFGSFGGGKFTDGTKFF